jgi:hypothetical protein
MFDHMNKKMADRIDLKCSYLVINTGYVLRLIKEKYSSNLVDFCNKLDITPLFIIDDYLGIPDRIVSLFILEDNNTLSSQIDDNDDNQKYQTIVDKLHKNKLISKGSIVFEVNSFITVMSVCKKFHKLRYCHFGLMNEFELLKGDHNKVEIIYVKYKCE